MRVYNVYKNGTACHLIMCWCSKIRVTVICEFPNADVNIDLWDLSEWLLPVVITVRKCWYKFAILRSLAHLARKDSCNVRLKKVQTWYEERNVSIFKVKSEFVIFLSTVILSYQKVSRDPRNLWTLTLKSPWNSTPLCAKVAHSQPWTVQTDAVLLFPCRWLQTPARWVWMLHRRLLLAQHLLRPKASKVQGVEDVEIPMLSPCSQMFQSYPLHKIGTLKYLEHFCAVLFVLLVSNRKEVSHGRLALLALQGLCLSYCNPWRKLVMSMCCAFIMFSSISFFCQWQRDSELKTAFFLNWGNILEAAWLSSFFTSCSARMTESSRLSQGEWTAVDNPIGCPMRCPRWCWCHALFHYVLVFWLHVEWMEWGWAFRNALTWHPFCE